MSSNASFVKKYGPWAVVTGASSGIGEQFARLLAAKGVNVILTARRQDRLEAIAAEIRERSAVKTHVIAADLTQPGAAEKLGAAVAEFEVGMLVNNAGMESMGLFVNESVEHVERLLAVNVSSVSVLARVVGKDMARRGRGCILFVSSLIARPSPYMSVYAASKAFVTTLAVSLKYEMKDLGVEVLAMEPGVVKTAMSDRAGEDINFAKFGMDAMQAEDAVRSCLNALGRDTVHTPGWKNNVMKFVMNTLPASVVLPLVSKMYRNALAPHKLVVSSN